MGNNVNWGFISSAPDMVVPGDFLGDGRCEAEQFGFAVQDVVVYGTLPDLRAWLETALRHLPADRDGDVVGVDTDKQMQWLDNNLGIDPDDDPDDAVWELDDTDWEPSTDTLRELFEHLARDPAAAGWTLAHDVKAVWAVDDEDEGPALMAGLTLNNDTETQIGIGEPLHSDDLAEAAHTIAKTYNANGMPPTTRQLAHAALLHIAERLNNAY